jgi:tetratricopeptide (TPR) repeat protein
MEKFKVIDNKIQDGYGLILDNECRSGCDEWLEAWGMIKELFSQGVAKDVSDLDKKYDWTEFIFNYTQDLEMELRNAGTEDKSYHQKCVDYCKELLQWCSEPVVENTRRGMADAYFNLGEEGKAEQLYKTWLEEDSGWGYGYIGWSDNYSFGKDKAQYDKAEEILLAGYAQKDLRDRNDVIERLVDLYKDMGKPGKANEYKKELIKLRSTEPSIGDYQKPAPVKVVKVGRNEPCPCGSGKKYKKCCLS